MIHPLVIDQLSRPGSQFITWETLSSVDTPTSSCKRTPKNKIPGHCLRVWFCPGLLFCFVFFFLRPSATVYKSNRPYGVMHMSLS